MDGCERAGMESTSADQSFSAIVSVSPTIFIQWTDHGSPSHLAPAPTDQGHMVEDPQMIWLEGARYQVPGWTQRPALYSAPENSSPALPNPAARTADFILICNGP